MQLKSQRRILTAGIAGISAIALGLGAMLASSSSGPDAVRLGKGIASVEAQPVSAFEPRNDQEGVRPMPSPSASDMGLGQASYYGPGLEGNRTASGEQFNPEALTAAHRTLPMGSRVRVTNPKNGESVVVRINDRGPFHGNRVIDLSLGAARSIGLLATGTGRVRMALLTS